MCAKCPPSPGGTFLPGHARCQGLHVGCSSGGKRLAHEKGAQQVKNQGAQRSQRLRRLSDQCHMRVMLTGTPLQNDLEELHNLLRFLLPAMFRGEPPLPAIQACPAQRSCSVSSTPLLMSGVAAWKTKDIRVVTALPRLITGPGPFAVLGL